MNPMQTYVIDSLSFTGKLSDVYFFLDYSLNALDEPLVKERELSKWMEGIPDMIRDERFINVTALSEKEFDSLAQSIEEGMKESYLNKFKESKRTVLNLSLVMLCTLVELFFEHVFIVIFKANPQTMLTLSKDKNITLAQFMKYGTYEEVFTAFVQKTVDHIIGQGTNEVFKAFDTIGIKEANIFSWVSFTEEVQHKFAGWSVNNLAAIFEERHSIVHDNAMPLRSVEELLLRKDFFIKIILNISVEAWQKFYKYGLILDAHDKIRTAIKASGGDPTSYPPPPKIKE